MTSQPDHSGETDAAPHSNDLPSVFLPAHDEERRTTFDFKELAVKTHYKPVTDWTIPEAFLCLILSAAVADGSIAAEEQEEVRAIAHRSRALKTVDARQLAQANTVVSERLKNRPNGLKEACEALPADMRLSVFAHCVDILLADGALLQAEAEFLNQITAFLELPVEPARLVVEVLLTKNRY